MDKITESQDINIPWYKKYWKYVVFAFLVVVTGGMYAAMQARQKQNKTVDKIDELDNQIIADKIQQANVLDKQIDDVVDDAEKISSEANKQLENISQEANKPVEQQVADLNSFMRDRR